MSYYQNYEIITHLRQKGIPMSIYSEYKYGAPANYEFSKEQMDEQIARFKKMSKEERLFSAGVYKCAMLYANAPNEDLGIEILAYWCLASNKEDREELYNPPAW